MPMSFYAWGNIGPRFALKNKLTESIICRLLCEILRKTPGSMKIAREVRLGVTSKAGVGAYANI
jgi:hypothetical protein